MFEHKILQKPEDYFRNLDQRPDRGVYFYRINGYNSAIQEFLRNYYEAARQTGVILEGKIPNPDEKNLAYYEEIMGMDFQMDENFISKSLKKWLPRMNDYQRRNVASSIYDTLSVMRQEGKNDNMLRNAYIKFMCWLYYRFERIVNRLGENVIPKILYEGEISNYELKLITVLSNAGCDVVLLQYKGDQKYLQLDPASRLSLELKLPEMTGFPENFSLKVLRREMEDRQKREQLLGPAPQVINCTNAWIQGEGLSDLEKSVQERGSDPGLFYNCFIRINGVEDKLTYLNELYRFQLGIKNSGRRLVILENQIPRPSVEEINSIRRKNYATQEQMLFDLSSSFKNSANFLLQNLTIRAFTDILSEEAKLPGMNLNKLTGRAVYLLCWFRRYQSALFGSWRMPEIGCLIYLGGCRDDSEALFLRFLSRLPVDVLILTPNRNTGCCLKDKTLFERNYPNSMTVDHFPAENAQIHMGTAAYHAERELDEIMYQDSGIYRNRQFGKAVSVSLQTMYEEISILWDQELKYRPNFSVVDSVVNIPVIFAKISGVKDGQVSRYWSGISDLITEDTFVIRKVPFIQPTDYNPVKAHAVEFFRNGKLQRGRIREHSCYQYGILREEIQDHILDKLQMLIDQKLIKGTFENGTEYTIISVVLNLDKNIVRLIQKFDFTRKNPKLIYLNTGERVISLEDSILTAFLNLVGFDVVFFVPTGYQSVEKYFNRQVMEEHQIGSYLYDLQVPELTSGLSGERRSWRDIIFKRGN